MSTSFHRRVPLHSEEISCSDRALGLVASSSSSRVRAYCASPTRRIVLCIAVGESVSLKLFLSERTLRLSTVSDAHDAASLTFLAAAGVLVASPLRFKVAVAAA